MSLLAFRFYCSVREWVKLIFCFSSGYKTELGLLVRRAVIGRAYIEVDGSGVIG